MRKIFTSLFLSVLLCPDGFSQNHSLNPTRLDAHGNPGDLMLSTLVVNNTGSSAVTLHMKRIIKNLPPNWTSCFCYPFCIAPFIDTLSFTISPFSCDSIKPNYGTDSLVPGIGYITIILYEDGFPNNIDTVAFSGSTLPLGVSSEISESSFSLFPNPCRDHFTVKNPGRENGKVSVYNVAGELQWMHTVNFAVNELDVSALPAGLYFIRIEFDSEKIITRKFLKQE